MENPGQISVEIDTYEDRLDAIVCAWCAIRALQGRVKAYGNDVSAIWIPAAER